jgi:hypothetical protein
MTENNRRERLFQELDGCLNLFHKKLHRQKQDASEQMGYGRLLLNTINSYAKLLDTEELEQRVETLEKQLENCVVIPVEEHKQKTQRTRR